MPGCIILVGLQGAGKTTLYRQRFAASHAHVSMDLFPNARHKSARLLRELARASTTGAPSWSTIRTRRRRSAPLSSQPR